MFKTCTKCGIEYPIEHFSKKGSGRGTRCSKCVAEYFKNYYHNNKERKAAHLERINRNNIARAKKVAELLAPYKAQPCLDCKQTFPSVCMDFDHLYDKEFNLSTAGRSWKSFEAIEAEIKKCEVVCSNCHRIRTAARRTENIQAVEEHV